MMSDYDDDDFEDDDFEDGDYEPKKRAPAPNINWSVEQKFALDQIESWRQGRLKGQIFRLFGYAGTGKTTVTKEIARRTGGNVAYVAYTGKASLVMQRMGCDGATTIHSLIYRPISELRQEAKALRIWLEKTARFPEDMFRGDDMEELAELHREAMDRWDTIDPFVLQQKLRELRERINAGPSWDLRNELKPRPDIIIVDECSMVGRDLAHDLMSFGIPIIAIGDPFQLPPVKDAGFFTNATPDAMLKEVHRQALGSPVTRMATMVRNDGAWALKLGEYGDSKYVTAYGDALAEILLDADQVLCGTHRNRIAHNAIIREALGYSGPMPMEGERLICKRNHKHVGLMNGGQWIVKHCEPEDDFYKAELVSVDNPEDEKTVLMHTELDDVRQIRPEDRDDAHQFEWGYCITVHASQGSQWPKVAIINDGWNSPETPRFWDRWLYTALTRAQQSVSLIKPTARKSVVSGVSSRRLRLRGAVAKPLSAQNLGSRGLKHRR